MMKNSIHFKALFIFKVFKFALTFWHCIKNGLIKKIRLISKFMTSQPGEQTITIHTSLDISQIKRSKKMKFGQIIEFSRRNIFLQKLCALNEAWRLVPNLFFF